MWWAQLWDGRTHGGAKPCGEFRGLPATHSAAGHRRLGKRRWDDPVQRHAEERTGQEEPWQAMAMDRAKWTDVVAGFVKRVLRRRGPAREVARGRLFSWRQSPFDETRVYEAYRGHAGQRNKFGSSRRPQQVLQSRPRDKEPRRRNRRPGAASVAGAERGADALLLHELPGRRPRPALLRVLAQAPGVAGPPGKRRGAMSVSTPSVESGRLCSPSCLSSKFGITSAAVLLHAMRSLRLPVPCAERLINI